MQTCLRREIERGTEEKDDGLLIAGDGRRKVHYRVNRASVNFSITPGRRTTFTLHHKRRVWPQKKKKKKEYVDILYPPKKKKRKKEKEEKEDIKTNASCLLCGLIKRDKRTRFKTSSKFITYSTRLPQGLITFKW